MDILHVVESTVGGVKTHLLAVLPLLHHCGYTQAVASPRVRSEHWGDTSFVDDIQALDIPHFSVEMSHDLNIWTDVKAVWSLQDTIRRQNPAIIHVHSSKAGLVGRLATTLAGRRHVIYSPHAFAFPGFEGWRRQMYLMGERFLAPLTTYIHCVSNDERDMALRAGIGRAEQMVVIPNSVVKCEAEPCDIRAKLNIPPHSPVMISVGRLALQKRPELLIEALAHLPTAHLVYVGDGALRPKVTRLAESLGVRDRVHLIGYSDSVPSLVAGCDVFVLSSAWEAGVPYALMEAMGLGVPAVVVKASGLSALTADVAMITQPEASDVAAAVQRLFADPVFANDLAKRGKNHILKYYDSSKQIRRLDVLYRRMMETKVGGLWRHANLTNS